MFKNKKSTDKNSQHDIATRTLEKNDKIGIVCDEIVISIDKNEYCHKIADIVKIAILTTDKGPFVCDVFLLVAMKDCFIVLPSEHSLYEKFLFGDIAGNISIDYHKIIEASSCAENAEFVLYSKYNQKE